MNHKFVTYTQLLLAQNADSSKAIGMKKYMRDQYEYFGVTSPIRKELFKKEIKQLNINKNQLFEITNILFSLKEREFQYVAIDLLWAKINLINNLDELKEILIQKSWWDTVDNMVGLFGEVILKNPELIAHMDSYIQDNNFWLRRVAILHQLRYKNKTNKDLLFKYCLLMSEDKEFFIRKAIGWALRQYARVEPQQVRNFVNHNKLSTLSTREDLKRLE